MPTIELLTVALGALAFALGSLLEIVAVVGMVSFRFRQSLPVRSPFDLVAIAAWCHIGGFALLFFAGFIRAL